MELPGLKLGKSLANRGELVAVALMEPVSSLQDVHPENVGDQVQNRPRLVPAS